MEAGSASTADAAVVKAGLNTKGGFPETDANGFSTEAGIVFNFDAAAATDGLATEAGTDAATFRFGLDIWSVRGEETEAGGVSSGAVMPVTAPVICAVFGTTLPSGNVV